MSTATGVATKKGGAWLIEDTAPGEVMTPEKRTEEHRLIGQTAAEFIEQEVFPVVDRLEQKDWRLNRELLRKCGALGLLGTNIPEAYGGVELDKISTLIVSEEVSRYASFGATFGAQANLTVLPIYMFGTEAQKRKYLPGLIAGDVAGAYCLSESGSGSDALGAKAKAVRRDDGSFVLSGEKMWITNGGFADVFIIFAKVDPSTGPAPTPSTGSGQGGAFTAFIVEKAWPGVSAGKEEHKMGLHGSSTTPVILQDVEVPADAVLGEVGKGHKVAFNVLNFGRFKLGAMTSGGAKATIAEAAKYAATRKQFGVPIATFGAIRHKLGEMTAREYALESMMYRTAGLIDAYVAAADTPGGEPMLKALEEFAVEASIAKVLGSEVVDYIIDENVQIHGGNGFVRDYPAESHYRDARVNRIFEGTNEINRLLIPGMLMKKAVTGNLALIPAAKRLQDEIMSPSLPSLDADEGVLAAEQRACEAFKKVVLLVAGAAMQRYDKAIDQEQEVLTFIADLCIDTYAAESAVLRAVAAGDARHRDASLHADAAAVFTHEAAGRIELNARAALAAMSEGDVLRTQLAALRRLLKVMPVNAVAMRRRLADATAAKGGYLFA